MSKNKTKSQKCKTLNDMKVEEIDNESVEPLWQVSYKNYTFIAYENSFFGERKMLSCYIVRDNEIIEHSGRTSFFTEERAFEELKRKFEAYLEMEVIGLLKEKANVIMVGPDMHNDPHITITFNYDNYEDWEKVKEYFDL